MESINYRRVQPARPVAPYIGGKRNLASRLVARIEAIEHETYCEVFVGMAGVFLRRKLAPKGEVINDYSRDVATFFRVLQRHYVPFLDMIRWQLTTRSEFERLVRTDPDTLTDLERSARFLYLQRTAFGGKVAARNFGVATARRASFDISRLQPILEEVHSRLSGVVIECLPWQAFLERYDRPGTLFYLDPPYYGSEGDYGPIFGRDQFELMADSLRRREGKFLLSINDHPEVRRIFAGFNMEQVETTYSLPGGGHSKRVGELIITGG